MSFLRPKIGTLRQRIICFIVVWWLRSLRIQFKTKPPKSAALIILWHEEGSIIAASGKKFNKDYLLVSASRDGDFWKQILTHFNWSFIRGSTNRKSVIALKEIINKAKTSRVFIATDGSRGPRRQIKPGAVLAAKIAKVPIYSIRTVASGMRLNSWDKHLMPFPFSKVVIHYSAPLYIKPDCARSEAMKLVKKQMADLEQSIKITDN